MVSVGSLPAGLMVPRACASRSAGAQRQTTAAQTRRRPIESSDPEVSGSLDGAIYLVKYIGLGEQALQLLPRGVRGLEAVGLHPPVEAAHGLSRLREGGVAVAA